jgi:predicted  nucleic acid-binding Zn-ribbon protein
MHEDASMDLLNKGCECGGKLFFFIKKEHAGQLKSEMQSLSNDQKTEMIQDVLDMIGTSVDPDEPVVLDLESVNVEQPGKYRIDLISLFKRNPVVYKVSEGKYIIDVAESFNRFKKKK